MTASRGWCARRNLGISACSLREDLGNLVAHGIDRKPQIVILTVCEGNDLRIGTPGGAGGAEAALPGPQRGERSPAGGEGSETRRQRERLAARHGYARGLSAAALIKSSPVIIAMKQAMIRFLGPINAEGPIAGGAVLEWMPAGVGGKYYAFTPKRLAALNWTETAYRRSTGGHGTAGVLGTIRRVCDEQRIRLIVLYAPTKARVVLPLVAAGIPAARLRGFVALVRKDLPPADAFVARLLERLDVKEHAVRAWCEAAGVEFVGVTGALCAAVARGEQVYFTYDQHWTPPGNELVAQRLAAYLRSTAPPTAPPHGSNALQTRKGPGMLVSPD